MNHQMTVRIKYNKKCVTKYYNGTIEEVELITKNRYYSYLNITPK